MSETDLMLSITAACLLFVSLIAFVLRQTDKMQSTTRAFKNIQPGEIFFDEGVRFRKLDVQLPECMPDLEPVMHNAIRADGILRSTAYFAPNDRFEVSVPIELKCAWWRRFLLKRSLRWQVNGSLRAAKVAWRLARVWPSEQTEMALAAYATSLVMLGE